MNPAHLRLHADHVLMQSHRHDDDPDKVAREFNIAGDVSQQLHQH